jgi:7-keto-8-aminopelargonate synthetase-like enzyme
LCKAELEKAAKHLQDKNYHPNSIGVQFVQIGDEEEATKMLKELAEADVHVRWFYPSSVVIPGAY